MRCYPLVAIAVLLASCASQPPAPPPIVKVVAPPPKVIIPPDPMADLSPDVRQAIETHQTPTLHDGITVLFPYDPNQQWTVYCQPLRATEIRLSPDESTDKDSVVLGDSVRWAIKIGRQAVMVEPLGTASDPNMTTNLVIDSNRRSYHLILKLRSRYMPAVQWYYPDDVRQQQAARQLAQHDAAAQAAQAADPPPPQQEEATAQ
jgi:type IV secretory pathway VirB9-like protein